MEHSRQEYWSELPFPTPRIFMTQRSNPGLLHWQVGSLSLCHLGSPVQFSSVTQSWPTLCDPMDCSLPRFSVHGIFPGKNTGVGCHFLLQRIFPTQRSNPGLLHYRQMLYCLSYQGSPTQLYAAAAAKSLQSCPTLCDPIDGSPPGSPVPGILQATLEWVAVSFSNA